MLVPDPVYAPLQSSNSALNTNLATGLVKGLLAFSSGAAGQGDWLSGATMSAFPKGSRVIKVTITGRLAQVDLGGGAAHATGLQRQFMEAQLQATLGDRSYSLPLATHVQLYINGKLQFDPGNANLVPAVATGPVFIVTGSGGVGQLTQSPRPGAIPAPKLGSAQVGGAQVTLRSRPTRQARIVRRRSRSRSRTGPAARCT